MDIIVGIGEIGVSHNAEDFLKTFALASCVGVTVYSPVKKVAGMAHMALPYSSYPKELKKRAGYYVSSGIDLLLNTVCSRYGCNLKELDIGVFGGADSIRDEDIFLIGRRNIEQVRASLHNLGIRHFFEDISGNVSRTVELEVATGRINVIKGPINI